MSDVKILLKGDQEKHFPRERPFMKLLKVLVKDWQRMH